jgi:ABC-type multidrug transport system fused ATPase/permease subunit
MNPSTEPSTDVRLLGAYLRPERGRLTALVGLLVVAMLLPLAGPLLVGRFIDAALAGDATSVLVRLAAAFLLATLTADALQLVVTWLSVRLAWRVGNALRSDLCGHALSLDLDWHADHSPGQLIERIDGDIDAVTRFSSAAVLHLLGNAILVVGVLCTAALIDWRAAVIIAVTVGVAVSVILKLRRIAVPYYDEEREAQGRLYGDVEERLGGLEDLRANGGGAWAELQLHRNSATWWHTARRAAARGDAALAIAGAVYALGSAGTLALGAWLVRRGEVSVGSVVALLRFSQLVSEPLWRVAEQLSEAQKALAGTRRAARLLADRSAIVDGQAALPTDRALGIRLRHVTFGYGTGHAVLDDVDLAVPAGTSLGVVGRTGSGKTTIGRLVARLWDTEGGSVEVGGIDVRDLPQRELRSRIGVVTQEVELFRASLRDNLTVFGAIAADDARCVAVLRDVGLGPWFDTLPGGLDEHLDGDAGLSAGEGQLLAFARAFLPHPAVVTLDAASRRLDPATEAALTDATDRLLAGRTAILIAHRLDTLHRVDAVAVLDHGRVLEHGARRELAAAPTSHFSALLRAAGIGAGTGAAHRAPEPVGAVRAVGPSEATAATDRGADR